MTHLPASFPTKRYTFLWWHCTKGMMIRRHWRFEGGYDFERGFVDGSSMNNVEGQQDDEEDVSGRHIAM